MKEKEPKVVDFKNINRTCWIGTTPDIHLERGFTRKKNNPSIKK